MYTGFSVYTVCMLNIVPVYTGYMLTQVVALTPRVSDGLWHEAVASIPMSGTSSALSTSMSRSSSLMAQAHTLTHSLCHRRYSCNHRCMYCGTCTCDIGSIGKNLYNDIPQNLTTHLSVTFNLDTPKIGSPQNEFFWNIWTHSEKFVPTVDQPHQGKSVLVNNHEVITKDINSVHRGIFTKLSDWFSSVCLDWPYTPLTKIFAQITRNWVAACGSARNKAFTLCAAELTGLNSFQKPQQPS